MGVVCSGPIRGELFPFKKIMIVSRTTIQQSKMAAVARACLALSIRIFVNKIYLRPELVSQIEMNIIILS